MYDLLLTFAVALGNFVVINSRSVADNNTSRPPKALIASIKGNLASISISPDAGASAEGPVLALVLVPALSALGPDFDGLAFVEKGRPACRKLDFT